MKRYLPLALACLLPLAGAAQEQDQPEEAPGFFGRLFGAGDEDAEGPGFLEGLIEGNLSGAGREVRIEGFEGALSTRATLELLTIADEEGVWLTMRDVVLDWNRSALLRGRLEVSELTADEILLPRLPAPAEPAAVNVPSPEAQGFSLPELPVSVQIDQVDAERVVLGEPLFGEEAVVSLEGSVTLADGAGAADIAVERLDEEGALTLEGAYDNATEQLAIDLALSEGPDGIVANLIDLPDRPSLDLTVQGDAPLSDFVAEIELETGGEPRLAGQVALAAEEVGGGTVRRFEADLGGDVAPLFLPEYQEFFGPDIQLDVAGAVFPDGRTEIEQLRLAAQALVLEGEVVIGEDGLPDLVDLEGRIASEDGTPVLLPMAGPETRVDEVSLDVGFDASAGEDWQLEAVIRGLDRPGFAAERVALEGTGQIASETGPEGAVQRSVTAALDFVADELDLGDPAAEQALGEQVTGRAEVAWTDGQPVRIDILRLEGETYALQAEARIETGETLTVAGEAEVNARDLSVFSGLAGRPLEGAAELTVQGEGEPLAGRFDLRVEGTTQDLAIGDPRLDPLLDGTATLTLVTDRSETGTVIETFRIVTPVLTAQAEGRLATGESGVVLEASLTDTSLVAESLSGPAELSLTANEDAAGWSFDLTASGSGAEIGATGTVVGLGEEPVVAADFTADVAELSAFSDLAGRELAGSIEATGEVRTGFDLMQAEVALDATTQDLALGLEDIDPLLNGPVELMLEATRAGDTLTIDAFRVDAPLLQATAEGVIRQLNATPAFDGTVSVAAPQLSAFSGLANRELGGALEVDARGQIDLDLSRFDLTVEAVGTDLDPGLPGVDEMLPGRTTVTVDAAREGDAIEIRQAEVEGQRLFADVSGTLTGLDATPAFDGRAVVRADEIAPLSELAGRELGGSIDVTAEGSAAFDGSRFDLEVEGTATDLDPGLPGAAEALAGRTILSAAAQREGDTVTIERLLLENPQVAAEVEGVVTDLTGAPAFDGTAEMTAPDLSAFSGLAGRPLEGAVEASLSGEAALDLRVVDVALLAEGQNLDLGLPGGAELLGGEARLALRASREGGAVTLSELSLESDNLVAEGSGVLTELDAVPVFDGELRVAADDLTPLAAIAGRPLDGSVTVQADGSVATDLSRFDLALEAEAQGLSIGQEDADRLLAGTTTLQVEAARADGVTTIETAQLDASGLDVQASGRLGAAGAELEVNARLADIGPYAPGFSGPVTVEGTVAQTNGTLVVDLEADGPGGIAVAVDGTIDPSEPTVDLDIEGTAPLAAANRFVQPRTLAGTVSFDLAMQGAPGLDALSGTITSDDARLVAPTFGVVLDEIELAARLNGGRLAVEAAAALQAGGSIVVGGSVGLTGNLPADLNVALNEAVLIDPELYQTVVSGAIDVDGPLRGGGGRISGEIALGPTEIRIPSTGLGAGGPIPEIEHVNEPAEVRATRARAGLLRETMDGTETLEEPPRNALALDILVRAENQIFVRGRGLDAELGGSLQLGGTTRNVIPSGQLELIRGRLDILGERLVLDEGSIRLQGDFVPIIRLVARTDTGDVTVLVVVEGPISEPEINFLSEPELPEDEVLARLLFGRGIENITALQAAQLAGAVATLAGREPGFAADLRENFGLDDLDITTDAEGDVGLRAGRYLTDNVYSDVVVGADGDTQINLNLDVNESVTVKGGLNNEGNSSLGIFFERDY